MYSGDFTAGKVRHRLIVGADYDLFDNTLIIDRYRSRFSGDLLALTPENITTHLLININNPVYDVNLNPDAPANTNRNEELTGYGIYIQDQIDLSDNFQLRLGLRYDDFEQDLTNFLAEPATTITSSDSRVSPQIGAGEAESNRWAGSDFELPIYTTAILFGEVNVTKNVTLRLDIDNLFDETFCTNSYANVWVEPGTPRRTRITASYSF